MKKKSLALLLTLLLLLPACGGSSYRAESLSVSVKASAVDEGNLNGPGAEAITAFAVDLLQKAGREENVLLSPVSVMAALAMTANGAASETLTQMEAMFGLPMAELNPYLHTYLSQLPSSKNAKCVPANSVWFRDDGQLQVEETFLQTNADYYNAEIFAAPFDASTVKDINSWIDRNTDGLIPQMLEEVPPEAMLYLINALVFDAEWREEYRSNQIREGEFFPEAAPPRSVQIMNSEEPLWLEDELASGFMKYYKDATYAFAALLPNEGVSLDEYIASLTGESLRQTLVNAEVTLVETSIPQFTCEYSQELSEVLQAMGMTNAFDPLAADFSAMGAHPAGNLYISLVLHKTYLSLDDKGTKAAAATIVESPAECAPAPNPKIVRLDRPFVCMLIDCDTRLPLFIGAIRDIGE